MEPNTPAIDWPTVLEKHKPWLTNVLRSRIGNRHEVDDLLQDIALAVVRQSARCPVERGSTEKPESLQRPRAGVPTNPDKVAPWLYRLAIRQAVNFHRRSNRKTEIKPVADLDISSEQPQPLDWMLTQENDQRLQDSIRQLRPQDREILMLKYTENWSYQRLSDHLGIPIRTVEYRLIKARRFLRKLVVGNQVTT